MQKRQLSLRSSAGGGDVIGEVSRIAADAGEERGAHFGELLQAEEIQAGHAGNAAAVNRLAVQVQTER